VIDALDVDRRVGRPGGRVVGVDAVVGAELVQQLFTSPRFDLLDGIGVTHAATSTSPDHIVVSFLHNNVGRETQVIASTVD